ncbi:hypothetical protein FRC06_008437 [Ceratobasidium sp. 370]|nr:hypothetical protein FRC06_008437 [Ceratobasidium sp. 370]
MLAGRATPGITIRKGTKLGSGGFVGLTFFVRYALADHDTEEHGRVVALKQSRASLRIRRPLLQHESRVLNLLSGHPTIPQVYAYGRIEHFELLSMQLLHCSLREVVDQDGSLDVAHVLDIADQMLAALEHVHSHNIVHRDIKPDNIMLQHSDSFQVCLIDFSFACRLPSLLHLKTPAAPSEMPVGVFGTLPYASLNAHENKTKLSYRDDLESLAYTLLWLLRGGLPWTYYTQHGTKFGRIRQVYEQKKRHNGSTLAAGLPADFGALVDYARSLEITEKPSYNDWQRRLKRLCKLAVVNGTTIGEHQPSPRSPIPVSRPPPPAEVGQVALVKLFSSIIAEGYTIQAGHEKSYIPDPRFDLPEWSTQPKPSVITQVEWDERRNQFCLEAVAITRRRRDDQSSDMPCVPVGSHGINGLQPIIPAGPDWPFEDSYCYVFRRPMKFYCLPTQLNEQRPAPSTWKVSDAGVDAIIKVLTPSPDQKPQHGMQTPAPDVRHDARMRTGRAKVFAEVFPLTHAHIMDDSIDWFSKRAWFDECVKAIRYNHLNNGRWWTGAWFSHGYHPKEGDVSPSYFESDFEEWEPAQQERETSITLATNPEELGGDAKDVLDEVDTVDKLDRITALEQDS